MSAYADYLVQVGMFLKQAEGQQAHLQQIARLLAARIQQGRVIHVFGPSHAGLMVQDLFYRAGGLVPIEPLLAAGLMLNERPITRTTALEQTSGVAKVLLRDSRLTSGDALIIASVSGRNPVVTELCTEAQMLGVTVIALTCLAYSEQVSARAQGSRLFELADHVIDLPGVYGDAVVALPGLNQQVGPTSTAVGSAILQGLMVQVSVELLELGVDPPIFQSANTDDGQAKNERWLDHYRARLSYL